MTCFVHDYHDVPHTDKRYCKECGDVIAKEGLLFNPAQLREFAQDAANIGWTTTNRTFETTFPPNAITNNIYTGGTFVTQDQYQYNPTNYWRANRIQERYYNHYARIADRPARPERPTRVDREQTNIARNNFLARTPHRVGGRVRDFFHRDRAQ